MDVEVDQAMKQCIRLIQTFQRQVADDGSLRAADEAPHFREVCVVVIIFQVNQ